MKSLDIKQKSTTAAGDKAAEWDQKQYIVVFILILKALCEYVKALHVLNSKNGKEKELLHQ